MNNYILYRIKQNFTGNRLNDVKSEVARELSRFETIIKPGSRICIAVGSRGIKNLVIVVKEIAEFLKARQALPVIIPAMGSHGEATAKGQEELLAGYGINEISTGVPVFSSMEVKELTSKDFPIPIYMDKYVYESDGVILVNRIKPHTDYHGMYESGLVKMAVIGLGKEKGASVVHSYGITGLTDLLPAAAKRVLNSGKILGGIALVEDAYDETMVVKALKHEEFLIQEPGLLEIAKANMPSLPVNDIDVLIIDQMGKDISGTGIDPNITGRIRINGQKEPENPTIKAVVVSDLTENSHGNAIGVGFADVITRKLYNKIDFSSTYINSITSSFLERAKIPIIASTDREAFSIALRSCGYVKKGEERIVRIKDTLHLGEVYVSASVLNSADRNVVSLIEERELFNGDEFSSFNS